MPQERQITLAGESFRLSYNVKTSLRLIEAARPEKSLMELIDSRRMADKVLLLVAGLDETHERDRKKRLSLTEVQAIADRMTDLIERELEASTADNALDHVFLPLQRAIAESGITGRVFTYDSPYSAVALGKAETTVSPT